VPVQHVIRHAGTKIICHAIDLAQLPGQLIDQMRALAGAVASRLD
jgi:hypothetical protein